MGRRIKTSASAILISSISSISFITFIMCITCITALSLSVTLPKTAQAEGYEQVLDRVKLYIDDKLYIPALNELKTISKTPKGQTDVRVFIALAKVSYKLQDITSAFGYLGRARSLPSSPEVRERLTELYKEWRNYYGLVRLESANAITRGVITLKRERRQVINPERRAILQSSVKQLSDGVDLPSVIYLPYGHYSANGVPFHLARRDKRPPVVEVILQPLPETTPTPEVSSGVNWLYVGIGGAILTAASVGGYLLLSGDAETSPTPLMIRIVP